MVATTTESSWFPSPALPIEMAANLCGVIGYIVSGIFNCFRETPLTDLKGIADLKAFRERPENYPNYRSYFKGPGVNYPQGDEPQAKAYYYSGTEVKEGNPAPQETLKNDNLSFTAINGVGVDIEYRKRYVTYLASLAGETLHPIITFISNPNTEWSNIIRYCREVFGSRVTPAAVALAEQWRNDILQKKKIIHVAHSEGCAITKLALTLLQEHERKNIWIIAVAPGAYISKSICKNVVHIVSPIDFVPYLDFMGRAQAEEEDSIKTVKPSYRRVTSIINPHYMFHQDYQEEIAVYFNQFMKEINSS